MRRRLLIVADDWEALEVYEGLLSPHFECICAPFGSEGLRLARHELPDAILLDLTLEEMHASEACEKLRGDAVTARIPITLVLNEGEAPFRRDGIFPLPGDRVIHRPYDFKTLVTLLGREVP